MYTVVFIDTENLVNAAVSDSRSISWPKLRDFLLSEVLGAEEKILFSFLYLPESLATSYVLKDAEPSGFALRLCRRTKMNKDSDKDTVDDRIKGDALKFLLLDGISHVVIVSDDAHMSSVVSEAINHRRKVTVVGSNRMAATLKLVASTILTMPL